MKTFKKEYFKQTWKRAENMFVIFLGIVGWLAFILPLILINAILFPLEYIFTGRDYPIMLELSEKYSDTIAVWCVNNIKKYK